MRMIALFFPAVIALKVNGKIDENTKLGLTLVFEFCVFTLLINVSVMAVISYVLNLDGITEVTLQSLSFFIVYSIMACVSALFWGIFSKVLKKNIDSAISKGK